MNLVFAAIRSPNIGAPCGDLGREAESGILSKIQITIENKVNLRIYEKTSKNT